MKLRTMAVLLAAAFLATACSGGKTLVSVNGKKITEKDFEYITALNPRVKAQAATPFGKKQILENMVDQELVYQAAIKKGIQRDAATKAKLELFKKVVVAQAYLESELKKAAKEYYEKNKGDFEKLQLAQILIKYKGAEGKDEKGAPQKADVTRSKDDALKLANQIKAKIDAGETFANAAKEYSEDQFSKNNGGDIGRVSRKDPRLERKGLGPLLEKAFTMQVGEVSGPIETSDGYHLITVTKGVEVVTFDEAEQSILFQIQNDEKTRIMDDLKKNAKVVWKDETKKAADKPEEKKTPEGVQSPAPEEKAPAADTAKPEVKAEPAKDAKAPEAAKVEVKKEEAPKK